MPGLLLSSQYFLALLSWNSSRQLVSDTSTPNFFAAARIRFQAWSRSESLTPSTWSKRAMASRTWAASFRGSLRSFGEREGAVGEMVLLSCVHTLRFTQTVREIPGCHRTTAREAAGRHGHGRTRRGSWHRAGRKRSRPRRPGKWRAQEAAGRCNNAMGGARGVLDASIGRTG